MRLAAGLLITSAVLFAEPPEHPKPIVESFMAKVVSIADGDTVSVLRGNRPVRIRLEGIDAPESKQEHSNKAKYALTKLVKGKEVRVDVTGTDRYGRLLAVIRRDGQSVNEQLVADGWTWHFKEYNSDPHLAELEVKAREAKVGLWAHPNAIPPWEYRAIQREAAALKKAGGEKEQATARGPPSEAKGAEPTPTKPKPKPTKGSTEPEPVKPKVELSHWLNTSSSVRHNKGCRWYGKTKRGRSCGADEGKACGICGG